MRRSKKISVNILLTVLILSVFFFLCLGMTHVLKIRALVPAIFTLAVFIISLVTDGYLYGIVASMLSILILNFVFTYPYFAFNFSIPENLISAFIMLVVTIMTCALVTKVVKMEQVRSEVEREKMRANLLRAVSHDLRTPLTTIYGSSSAIIDKYDDLSKERVVGLLQGINEDAQWLVGMVENLLSVTKIDNSKVKIVKTETVLEELIDAVLIRFKKRYPNQKVQVDIPDEFIVIPMDAVLIEQVITNILENAVQHAVGMTQLRLAVCKENNCAVFTITDNGSGMDKERLKNIFTGYFEKKETPIDNQRRSMGIGLPVCASIIKAHEGTISAANRPEGGCCFTFSLKMGDENE